MRVKGSMRESGPQEEEGQEEEGVEVKDTLRRKSRVQE